MSISPLEAFSRRTRRIRYAWSPRLLFAELLLKQWFEPVIPFTLMIGLAIYFSLTIHDYGTVKNALSLARLFAEFGFVALAMAFTLISGGIDLSVGAIFAVANFTALFCMFVLGFPAWLTVLATLLTGAVVGAGNGLLIGYLKARPFLTTLVTLIILRACVNLLDERFATVFATNSIESDAWDFLGEGDVLGVPVNAAALIFVLLIGHVFLSRSRYGWHLTAIGASRKAARHAGIRVERMLLATYVLSGVLCALGGVFYAARQGSTNSTTGLGWEFQAVTAVVLGGASVAGGRGTVWRAMIGAIIIFMLTNGLVRMGIPGYVTSAAIGVILLTAVSIDVKWAKNRGKVIQKTYVNPARAPAVRRARHRSRQQFSPRPERSAGSRGGHWTRTSRGPRGCDRRPAGIGSTAALAMATSSAFRAQPRAMRGVRAYRRPTARYAVRQGGEPHRLRRRDGRLWGQARRRVFKVTDETNRTWYKLNDDFSPAHGRRSRYRGRRQDLLQRLHDAL